MITYQFRDAVSPRFGTVLKPIIPVSLIGSKDKMDVLMLVDSEADLSIIPYSVGELIGLSFDIENRREVRGVGEGRVPYILCKVKLKIGEYETDARIGWALIEEVPFILGRLDVFQNFSVEFREFENAIILKQRNEFTTVS